MTPAFGIKRRDAQRTNKFQGYCNTQRNPINSLEEKEIHRRHANTKQQHHTPVLLKASKQNCATLECEQPQQNCRDYNS